MDELLVLLEEITELLVINNTHKLYELSSCMEHVDDERAIKYIHKLDDTTHIWSLWICEVCLILVSNQSKVVDTRQQSMHEPRGR